MQRKVLLYGAGLGSGVYLWDQTYNRRALSRTCRTIATAAVIGIDYKLNFAEGKDISALHERSAERLLNLIRTNKGLYIKLGQSLAIQGNMLPPAFREGLSTLFDNAPQDTWVECQRTLRQELGTDPSNVFEWIDHEAVASASIAQVHRAKLHDYPDEVAVKIQHADVEKLTWWDLKTYKAIMFLYDRVFFKLPIYFAASYMANQVQRETDFRVELANAEEMAGFIEQDPVMRKRAYVPKLYPDFSTPRVLVMEWIEGVGLSKKAEVERQGFNVNSALQLVFELLTKQTFDWGVVHCDPHPGNWILRWHNGRQQLVMLDHGLYVHMSPKLREEYALLWRAMFRRDISKIAEITTEWGFGDPELFASATMLQSYNSPSGSRDEHREFERHQRGVNRLREFLKDTERIPLALIFVGRAQRILQGLNRLYGAPVNRVRILIDGALLTPVSDWRPWYARMVEWIYRRTLLLFTDAVFLVFRIQQLITKSNPEDAFDRQIEQTAVDLVE